MARIELSNIGGGGGTTLSLTTTGTSGASTLAGSVLNIPIYQGQLTLTTTGTSGAATLVGDTLNIPNYATGGNPAGSAGQVQFNSTPAGSFAASANLAWDNTAVQLNINTPLSPTGKLNVKGSGATSSTVNTRLTDSGNAELLKVLDNGSTNIGANFNWDNVNGRLGLGTSTPNQTLEVSGAMRLTGTAGTAAFMLGRNSAGDVSTVTLGTTGTSGAATLSANVLNIPQYQGALTLSTAGTTGASTLVGNTLTIPTYQGQLTLTTTGTSGAATLVGNTLNIPQYSGGGGTPAGSTGEIQYNNAGAFSASANLAWDNSNVRLNIGAPSSPTARLNVKGGGSTSATINTRLTNSGNVEILKVSDDGELTVYKPLSTSGRIATFYGYQAPFTLEASIEVGMQSSNDGIVLLGGSNSATNAGGFLQTKSATSRAISFNQLGAVSIATSQIPSSTYSALSVGISSNIGTNIPTSDGVQFRLINGTMTHSGTSTVQSFLVLASFKPSTINRSLINTTYTNAVNIYIDGPPINGGGVTFTNTYSIYVNSGQSYFGGNIATGVSTASARLHVRGSNASSGTNALLVQNTTPDDIYKIENDGKISYLATNTAAGTTGAQTINRPSGTVNFGIGAGSLVVTNSLCTTSSIVFATVRTNDATAQIKNVVPAAGSFTINLSAAATAETSVGFFIIN